MPAQPAQNNNNELIMTAARAAARASGQLAEFVAAPAQHLNHANVAYLRINLENIIEVVDALLDGFQHADSTADDMGYCDDRR